MTLQTQINQTNVRLEFIVCIEGIGFPTDPSDLTDGFVGTVFTNADFDANMAATLGCTVKKNLKINSSFSDEIDTREMSHKLGDFSFNILDDGTLLAAMTPHYVGSKANVLNATLEYGATTVTLDAAAGDLASFVAGETIWIGGREAILLGTKTASSPQTFTGCTRGYLGTQRGAINASALGLQMVRWLVDMPVVNKSPVWSGKQVNVYVREPGGALSAIELLWTGILEKMSVEGAGFEFSFEARADVYGRARKRRRAPVFQVRLVMSVPDPVKESRNPLIETITVTGRNLSSSQTKNLIGVSLEHAYEDANIDYGDGYTEHERKVAMLTNIYHYRPTDLGTKLALGPNNTFEAISVLDRNNSVIEHYAGSMIYFGADNVWLRALYKAPNTAFNQGTVLCSINHTMLNISKAFEDIGSSGSARVLLDNYLDDYKVSRFQIDREVRRNPIDVLLMFMTTFPSEFEYLESDAGSTETSIIDATKAWTTNQWAGYTVFCCDGDNAYYTAIIDSNNATTLTLRSPGFPAAVPANIDMQIRNSKYDCLPLTWGMSIHHNDINIAAFEEMRDKHFSGVELGRFAVGAEEVFEIADFIETQILQPFGVILVRDRSNGKIIPRFINIPVTDGVVDDFVDVTKSEIHSIGSVDFNLSKPLGTIEVKIRETNGYINTFNPKAPLKFLSRFFRNATGNSAAPVLGTGAESLLVLKPGTGFNYDYMPDQMETLELDARIFTKDTVHNLVGFLQTRMQRLVRPPPIVTMQIDLKHYRNLALGGFGLFTTDADVINPYTASRGWTELVGRVISWSLSTQSPTLDITIEMLGVVAPAGKICPAVKLSGANAAPDYFSCLPTEYTYLNSVKDYYGFAVGDSLSRFSADGTSYGATYVIASFGANSSSTPEGASTDRINTTGSVPAYTAGDYLTYATYSAAYSAGMRKHVWVAHDTTGLTGGGDPYQYG